VSTDRMKPSLKPALPTLSMGSNNCAAALNLRICELFSGSSIERGVYGPAGKLQVALRLGFGRAGAAGSHSRPARGEGRVRCRVLLAWWGGHPRELASHVLTHG